MRQTAAKSKVIAVQDLMTRDVKTCRPDDMLDVPARIMWDHDCGCVPVVDDSESVVRQRELVGMITDRDICMATYTQGIALGALRVSNAMSVRGELGHGQHQHTRSTDRAGSRACPG